jgi:hypothetical protein
MFFSSSPSERPLPAVTWEQRLESASGEREIVAIAREFLAMFDPFELHALPEDCRPPAKIVDGDDISNYAFDLVRYGCGTLNAETTLLHRLANFFTQAGARLSQVNAARGSSDPESRHSA